MSVTLNLARKWRSKNFDQIVGQDLSVRMLRNSLYKNQYFPVYLFSGQRGCGKTSTARVFAAAINCTQLTAFQKKPKASSVPCLICPSCRAMEAGRHPDFIEIDGASHTGVDHVRQIVDAASLLPLMGEKKVYLIDEAHMLSRAAFNAFLKILEEPPASVVFILATTDPEKIIDTVRSRCFQLFFPAVGTDHLEKYLAHVCTQESIRFDLDALALIVVESQGCIRDAMNILEQVRFSSQRISVRAVYDVLGYIDDESVIMLMQLILAGSVKELFSFLQKKQIARFSAEHVWRKLVEIIRIGLWLKHGVAVDHFPSYAIHIAQIIEGHSWHRLYCMFEFLYAKEQLFVKTTAAYPFLETVLLRLCQQAISQAYNDNGGSSQEPSGNQDSALDASRSNNDDIRPSCQKKEIADYDACWQRFKGDLDELRDPLIISLFRQAHYRAMDAADHIEILFPEEQRFLQEILEETSQVWRQLLHNCFGPQIQVKVTFTASVVCTTEAATMQPTAQKTDVGSVVQHVAQVKKKYVASTNMKKKKNERIAKAVVDLSDETIWPRACALQAYFPGTVIEIESTRQ